MHAVIHSILAPHRDRSFPLPLRVLCAGLATLAGAACGRNDEAARDTSAHITPVAITACDLLSPAEVTQALQSPVGEPQEQVISTPAADRAGISQCTYTSTAAPARSVGVFLRQSPARDNDPAAVRSTLSSAGTTVSDVAGVGDAAFWDGATLHVFSGGHFYLTIGVTGTDARQEQAKALALAALGRIGAPTGAR